MARFPHCPLRDDVHAKALARAKQIGRERAAVEMGISRATLERALAYAPVSPLVRRAIETAVSSPANDSKPQGCAA
jgi:hypothetical protein